MMQGNAEILRLVGALPLADGQANPLVSHVAVVWRRLVLITLGARSSLERLRTA